MVDFFIFCLATVGLTAILVHGEIFLPLRDWLERHRSPDERQADAMGGTVKRHDIQRRTWCGFLLKMLLCYQCCGFWSGLFCGIVLTGSRFVPLLAIRELRPSILLAPLVWLMCGFAGSFLAMAYDYVFDLIIAKRDYYRHAAREPQHDEPEHNETEHDETET